MSVRFEQALRIVYKKRNCEAFSKYADAGWPPCCSECACVADAQAMVDAVREPPKE